CTARPFSDRDEAALGRLADQAAIAIRNARLLVETERRRGEAESLAEVGRLISRSLEPTEVGQRITDSVCRLFGSTMSALYLIDPPTENLVLLAGSGAAVDWNRVLPRGTAAAGLAVSGREPVFTPDVLDDARIALTPEIHARMERSGYRAVLALPLAANERVFGALVIGDRSGRTFGADEIRLAQTFVDQAVIALENARLHAETTRRKREAEVLSDVGRLFAEPLDADQIAQRIVDSLRALLGAASTQLMRLDPASGDLVSHSVSGDGIAPGVVLPAGAGAMGIAVRTRRPVASPNLLADPRITFPPHIRALIEAKPFRAGLAVALIVNERVIGALAVGDREGRVFGDDEIRLAQAFADQVAMALENARLFEDAERRRREAEVFAELTGQITASLDLDTILSRVGEAARDLCAADLGWVGVRDLETGAIVLRYWPGARAAHAPVVIEPGKGIGGQVLATGRPFRTDDYRGDGRITQDYESIVTAEDVVTALVVPIQIEERIEGLLYVENRTPRPFTDRDEAQLTRLAAQAAIAIKNARLLEALRVHQGRLEALLDVSQELARIQPVESLLDAIARACGQVLDSTSVGFRLVEGDELVVSGAWGDVKEAMLAPRLKIGESLSGLVAATGAPLVVNDVANDPRVIEPHRAPIARAGYTAWLGVPVKVGERIAGVLFARTKRAGGFSREDQEIAMAFASQAATAIENARLFQQVQVAAEEVSRANEALLQAQKMDAIVLLRRLQLDDKSRQDLELIQRTARRAATLTQQLLAFSRKQVLQPKILGLNAVVAELAVMLRRLIGEDIDLAIVPGAGLDRVKADPGQLEQVLMNLAVNARDAMPEGGRLVIETATVELGEAFVRERPGARPGPHVRLSVTDEGAGMTPEVRARVFEPFFTTKEKGRGTGLGLSTVYGIVKQHNGTIDVRSAPGEGTAFEIYLPRVDTEAIVETEEGTAGAPRGSETVLLVEDEDEVRELAREILEMAGYTVLEAPHGPDALRLCRHHQGPIHLLLSDVVMPQMSGRELARQLVALRPDTKVAYMSGYTDDALGHHGVLDPDVVLLPKPFTPDSLVAGVRRALDPPGPVS
ncbi:MAG: GAF domain-containing protein, partial [Candidatus Rokubacteria bacterium]|nr:GAF domain-containing protein [Candidatus Rokubacteria bacterium]